MEAKKEIILNKPKKVLFEKSKDNRLIDLTGLKIGRLTVLGIAYRNKHRQIVWKCQCECGNIHYVIGQQLRLGKCLSCGCYEKENLSHLMENRIKHNFKKDPHKRFIYGIWKGIRRRCYDTKDKRYNRYGGRGISVCKEWKENPIAFVEWALSHGYKRGLQIDRINNDGDYSPENCRFVTNKENHHNSTGCKISQEQAEQIRIIYAKGNIKQVDLGNMFGISQQVVSKIVNYKLWT